MHDILLQPAAHVHRPPPSRHNNPFATCWIKPGAIPFHFAEGSDAEQLVERLARNNWRGAITGPHGSGKSTLLETLKPAIIAAGRFVRAITLRDKQRRLPAGFVPAQPAENTVLIIDGYEQLGWFERLRLSQKYRGGRCGLLVTSHSHIGLPTLIKLAPNRELVTRLVAELCDGVSTAINSFDVAASHACHGSNIRDIFFDLYDRHEKRRHSL